MEKQSFIRKSQNSKSQKKSVPTKWFTGEVLSAKDLPKSVAFP